MITGFLESLALQWKGKPIAVILSGLDSDGAEALPAIKAAGGITFAQKIDTAVQPSMPGQAVETGCVDFELTPLELAANWCRIARGSPGVPSLPKSLPDPAQPAEPKATAFPIVGVGASAAVSKHSRSCWSICPRNRHGVRAGTASRSNA